MNVKLSLKSRIVVFARKKSRQGVLTDGMLRDNLRTYSMTDIVLTLLTYQQIFSLTMII